MKTPASTNGKLRIKLEILNEAQAEVELRVTAREKPVASFKLKAGEWNEYEFEIDASSAGSADKHISLDFSLSADPFFPPRTMVLLRKVTVAAGGAGKLTVSGDLLQDKNMQFPVKLTNCYRSYHEIEKLGPVYPADFDLLYEYSAEKKIYFGDIHVHSNFSVCGYPCNKTIEENALIAMERGHDFICFTDHTEQMDIEAFDRYFKELEKASANTHMLIIPSIEWTSFEHGHRNIYFNNPDDAAKIPFFDSNVFETNHPAKLKAFFEERAIECFGATHHPAYIAHLANLKTIDNDFEPLIEIYSTWGSSEKYKANMQESRVTLPGGFVHDALNKGLKLGFVGGGDAHNTVAGDGGITGVIASELTAAQIWQAMKSRFCYACSNDLILLDFHINGYPMGSILKVNQYSIDKLYPIHIAASAVCPEPVDKIELIQNGEVVYTKNHRTGKNEIDLYLSYEKFETPKGGRKNAGHHTVNISRYYYVRVTQSDGSIAWSSPIWIDFEFSYNRE